MKFALTAFFAVLASTAVVRSASVLEELVANSNSTTSGKSYDLTTLISLASGFSNVLSLLNGTTNLTLFAPTNLAISTYLAANPSVAASLKGDALLNVLQYHVVVGSPFVPSYTGTAQTIIVKTALSASSLGTNATQNLVVKVGASSGVSLSYGLGSATVIDSITADNGIIHVVDGLLIPPSSPSSTATSANLTGIVSALSSADLVSTVDGLVGVTIFIPTNAAFNAISNVSSTLSKNQLGGVLKYHVVSGVIFSPTVVGLANGTVITTILGQNITIGRNGSAPTLKGVGNTAGSNLVTTDILLSNGVAHIIDAVLIPNVAAIPSASSTVNAVTTAVSTASSTSTPKASGATSHSSSSLVAVLVALIASIAIFI